MIYKENYEVNIGIEVHVQLNTKSKIFCSCDNSFSHEPNISICEICTGQPGSLPVLNKQVVNYAVKAGLATNCDIAYLSKFDRKHYFYPDLPKNYQITQNYIPICSNGYIEIKDEDDKVKKIKISRIHIEEDAGKNIHSNSYINESFVDLNRAGTPLLEIVTYPDISSSYQAREYLKNLRLIMLYLKISTGNMQEGAFRADTNISVRKLGEKNLGTKCELKNINSFKFISDAIEYEINRQIDLIESGKSVIQETRLWDTVNKKTVIMRSKEEAADYRYFNDPDLPYISLDQEYIDKVRLNMPELPNRKFEKLLNDYNLNNQDAEVLISDLDLLNYFESAYGYNSSKNLINFILKNLLSFINQEKISISEFKLRPEKFANLVELYDKNIINNKAFQQVFEILAKNTDKEPIEIVKEYNLEQIDNSQELEKIIKDIIDNNQEQVKEYKSGKIRVYGFFVGQAMQKTNNNADPKLINKLLKKYLD